MSDPRRAAHAAYVERRKPAIVAAARERRKELRARAVARHGPCEDGRCHCGCGLEAPLAIRTVVRDGWIEGEPRLYVHGHVARRYGFGWREEPGPLATPCRIWQQAKDPDGYGIVTRDDRLQRAHRYFYELAHGPIPSGLVPDHLCRNPSCVHPDHLEVVTVAENTRRGRSAKLNVDQAREIRRSRHRHASELAAVFGVSEAAIYAIWRGKNWKDVE